MDAEVEGSVENNVQSGDEAASPSIDGETTYKGVATGPPQENNATPNINGNTGQATPEPSEGESQWYVTKKDVYL